MSKPPADSAPHPDHAPRRGFDVDRRTFLKTAGFAMLAAGCARPPVEKAIPLLVQPEELVPGTNLWYASACAGCAARCGTLVKCRDGRPIKLEGNPAHPLSRGGLCAVGQASLLGLYDSRRLAAPVLHGKPVAWPEVDVAVGAGLHAARRMRLLTDTLASPTEERAVRRFLAAHPGARHVVYDPLSCSALLDAHQQLFGLRVLPRMRIERATAVVAFDADFLGTWISPVEATAGYAQARDLSGTPPRLLWHAQIESRLSPTGARADRRWTVLPGEIPLALAHLAARLLPAAGMSLELSGLEPSPLPAAALDELAARLAAARGSSLVLCGSNSLAAQTLVAAINQALGNYGRTLDLEQPSLQRQGDDRALAQLIEELERGAVDALLVRGVNPVYDLQQGTSLRAALAQVPLVVSFAERVDETAAAAHAVCPEPHTLETWRDAEPVAGLVTVMQPALRPLGSTRAFCESLAAWSGAPRSAYEQVRDTWREDVLPRVPGASDFEGFWTAALDRGFVEARPTPPAPRPFDVSQVQVARSAERPAPGQLALVAYPKISQLDGRHAHNPWLQELPDPVSKATWDNYAALAPSTAAELGLQTGDVVRVAAAGTPPVELPVLVQPGQHPRTVAVALGYGRAGTDRFADVGPRWWFGKRTVAVGGTVGANAAPWLRLEADGLRYDRVAVEIEKTGRSRPLATTQRYDSLDVPAGLAPPGGVHRPIAQETVLAAYRGNPRAGAPEGEAESGAPADLWPAAAPGAHRWGMAIDLNACTGCSACAISCQAENNVPVVGRDEVQREREMHWLRLDRYYAEGPGGEVDVAHQPMLCQHCGHAPCETVCPVLATMHSSEGLNQQVYNRCVGTRYCANNCPYKVRRFNWFDYPHEDPTANLALNPDVTVRSRGVMEKCSLCVQRIQAGKIAATTRGTPLRDGEIKTACEQSCPARAIVFGDLADPQSRIAAQARDPRAYRALEELGVQPSIFYLRRVRNRDQETT